MHGQFLWFSARIGSEISFQKFLFNFACYCIEYSTCRYFFVENFLHARQKRKYLYTIPDKFSPTINILFHWFYPLIEKRKKKKKRRQYIHHQRAENESQKPTIVFTITRSIYFPPLHPSPHSKHEQFLFLRVSVHFILFHGSPPPSFSSRKSVFRPLTSIKPKACCIQIFISRGEIARPFWSRQLSKSSRIVCEALYRPAKALAPSLSYRTPSTPSRSLTHPFPPPPANSSCRRGGKQGGGYDEGHFGHRDVGNDFVVFENIYFKIVGGVLKLSWNFFSTQFKSVWIFHGTEGGRGNEGVDRWSSERESKKRMNWNEAVAEGWFFFEISSSIEKSWNISKLFSRELESFYCFTVWIKYSRIRTEDSGKLIRDIENNFVAE